MSPILRRLPALLLAIACLLLGTGAAGAGAKTRTHNSACKAAVHVHASHASHACAKRSHAKHRRHPHKAVKSQSRRHHTQSSKGKSGGGSAAHQAETTPAVCENGSTPSTSGQGTFACDDGSEPVCENGSEPASTSGGSKLVCAPNPDTGPSFGEECELAFEGGCAAPTPPICQDGSAPIWSKQGYYSCRYGEPTCETGSEPTFSSNGTILYCEAAESGDES